MDPLEISTQIRLADFVRSSPKAVTHNTLIRNLILDNCQNSSLCSDLRALDVNKYSQGTIAGADIPLLRDMFVDNICYFMLVPSASIKNGTTSECGQGCVSIDSVVRQYNALPEISPITCSRKPLRTVNFHTKTSSVVSTMLLQRIARDTRILERYRAIYPDASPIDFGYVTYKVALSSNSLVDVLRFLRFANSILAGRGLFQQDIDLTEDVGCSFDKQTLAAQILARAPPGTYSIVDNDRMVGTQCLTFMYTCNETGIVIRFKIYNKFIQSLETAGLTEMFGYSLHEWINNKDPIMRDTVTRSLEYGFTRLEMTIYAPDLYEVEWYREKMQLLRMLTLDSDTLFKTPISEQWQAFADEICCNMAVIDLVSMELGIAMWANSLTQRVGGVFVKIPKRLQSNPTRLQDWVAAHYSLARGPINIITVDRGDDDEHLSLLLRSFRKTGTNLVTYIPVRTRGGNGFVYCKPQHEHQSPSAFRENDPVDVGLVDTTHVRLRISEKIVNAATSALACEFVQEIPLVDTIGCRTTRQRNAAAREALDVEALALEMAKVRIINDQRHETAEAAKRKAALEDEFHASAIKNLSTRVAESLIAVAENTTVRVFAFKPVNTRWEAQKYILWTDCGSFWSNAYIGVCIDNNIAKFDRHAKGHLYRREKEHAFTFVRAGNSASGCNAFARVHSFYLSRASTEPNVEPQPRVLETIPALRNIDLLSIDTLEEDTIFEIQGIATHTSRGKVRYHVQIDGKYYLSNNWLEQAMHPRYDAVIDDGIWIECRSLQKKTHTSSRRKELQFVV